ncbi:cytochrome P450 CYP82D47-like [Cucurbita pepo subsp. pepo]|uniref:cytochrome P450 CYP82D47-like n=1 Tax=Cucurbita pepo subsp. pepo TaxID=3664 RepID=UPI000C9D68FC|nr:cytochrome P450 CYP82D47-like [Cucurbita pepo subsp. pepo]
MQFPETTSMEIISPFLNIVGLCLLLLFSVFILKKQGRACKGRHPPEADGGWPIIGHLRLLVGPKLPYETLGDMADKYGPIFTIRVGVRKGLVISNWEVAKECYTTLDSVVSSRPKSVVGELLSYNFAGFGFRPYYDSFYRSVRKIIISKLLSNRRLALNRDVRVSEVKRAMKELYDLWITNRDLVVDMDEWIGNINLNVSLMMVCGKRFVGDDAVVRRCRKAMREFFDLGGQFMVGDAIPFLRWLDLGGYEKAMKTTSRELDCLITEWLEEHRRKRHSSTAAAADSEHDFMDVMLSILEEGTMDLAGYDADTVIKATCMTLIAGGTDTMTVTVTWAISSLLNNREILRKAQEELDMHVGKERVVDESDISKLVYLQAIVKETFRLYPPGPLGGVREFSQDCTVGGYNVAAGTRLITNLWKIQTDPRVWAEPLEFKPERFLGRQKQLDVSGKNFELGPFGYGRRACPGLGIGVQMTQLLLATLIHSFEIGTRFDEPVDMAAVNSGLTARRVSSLKLLVKPRLLPSAYAVDSA